MRKDRVYQNYVADTAKNINEILANNLTGKYMQYYMRDIFKPVKESTETAEEIIERIKHGLDEIGARNGRSDIKSTIDA